MLKKYLPKILNVLHVTVVLFVVVISQYHTPPYDSEAYRNALVMSTGPQSQPFDTVRMHYSDFLKIEEKNKQQKQYQKTQNEGGLGSGISTSFIGLRRNRAHFELGVVDARNDSSIYYVELPNYMLKAHVGFNYRNDKNWLKYPVWDEIKEERRHGHYEEREVPFRYAYDKWDETSFDTRGKIMIPISQQVYNFVAKPGEILMVLFMLLCAYFIIILPARILIHMSRGEVFTKRHVKQLRLISIVLLVVPVFAVLLQLVLRLAFDSYIPEEVTLNMKEMITVHRYMLLASLVFFAISVAFKRGLDLQNEQDLTV